jgi:PKD repeat protein
MKKIVLLLSLLCSIFIMHASIIHVPSHYSTISAAFSAAADGDTIMLAKGTYTENLSVSNKSVVIASQYLFSKDESDIDGTVWLSAADPQTPNHTIHVSGSRSYTLSLIGIVFKNNPTTALYFSGYNFIASHLKFFTNTGGALSIWDGDAIIKHSIFEGNSRNDNGGAVDIQLSNEDRTVVIDSCQFKSNTSPSSGGGLKGSVYKSSLTVSNSFFASNTAYKGGAIAISPGTNAYVTIKNNVIVENKAQLEGGGIHMSGRGSKITNNTIVNNQLTQHGVNNKGAGVFLTGNNTFSYTYLTNNIIKFNATESTDKEVYANYQSGALYSKVYLAYCNLSDNTADYYSENSVVEFEYKEGNISANPLFVDTQNGDYSLQSSSPCIDAGDPDTNANSEDYKYDLEDRDPDGTRRDMGAIYFHQNIQPQMLPEFGYQSVGYFAPLVVEFSDSTDWVATNPPTTWEWDFNNDGIIDSYEQNPIYVYEQPGTYTVKFTVSNDDIQNDITRHQAIEVLSSQKEIENIDIRFAGQNYEMGDALWEEQGVAVRVDAEFETSSSIHDGGLWLHPAVATFDFTELQGQIYNVSIKTADWCPPSGCTTVQFYYNNQIVETFMTTQSSGVMHLFSYGSNQGVLVDSMVVHSFEGVIKYVQIQKEKIENPCKIQSQLSIEAIDCTNFQINSTISNDEKPYLVEWFLNDEVYSNEESFEIELLEAGVYTFKLVVTDELDNTCAKIREQSVTIVEQPTISIFPTVDKANKQVSLKGVVEGITDYTYSWDFGDGSPVNTTDLDRLVHDYNTNGEYTITLTVTPNNTQNCSYQQELTVSLDNCYLEGELNIYQIACNQFAIGSNVQNNNQSYSAQWYVNDVLYSDNEISPITLPVGKHMIRLELNDQNLPSCTLTLTEEIHVYNPVITINTIVHPSSKQLSFNAVVQGMDEFDFYWYFGDNGNGSGDDTVLSGTYTYPSAGTYDIAFSLQPKGSMGGCSYHKNIQVVIPEVQQNDPCDKATIKGKLNADIAMLIANAVQVDVYKKNSNDKYELLKSASISQSGDFEFLDLVQGEYLLVGRIINPEQYPLVVASYFNQMMEQVFSWQEASPIQLVCNATAHVELSMITLEDLLTGGASISGYVYYEGGTRNLVLSALQGKRGINHVLDNLLIYLYDTNNNQLIAQTVTDENGYYNFDGVPPGDYAILIEQPGLPLIGPRFVNVDNTNTRFTNNDYMVTFSGIIQVETTWLTIQVVGNGSVKVGDVAYTTAVPVAKDEQVTISAIPDNNNLFVAWSGDLASTDATETVTMNTDKTITASFDVISDINEGNAQDIVLYPSPVKDELHIQSSKKIQRLVITNIAGVLVYETDSCENSITLSSSNWASGVYIVRMYQDATVVATKKIVKF